MVERILRGEWAALELDETVRKFRHQPVGMVEREYTYTATKELSRYWWVQSMCWASGACTRLLARPPVDVACAGRLENAEKALVGLGFVSGPVNVN
ncbi:hypothetical protein ACP70R_047724 [Stipagrostis hirtigluma subsp. patula]